MVRAVLVQGPIRPATDPVTWPQACWVGTVTLRPDASVTPHNLRLRDAEGYHRARLLVRDGATPRGFVTVPIDAAGTLDRANLLAAVDALPPPGGRPAGVVPGAAVPSPALPSASTPVEAFSVVVCTRERPDDLRITLETLMRLDHPDFEIVVVDNAPETTSTAEVVAQLGDDRVRRVVEPRPGLSRARNRGAACARHEWLAFTDDDVVVDPGWLRAIETAIARSPRPLAAVTGLVPAAELATPAQRWFDERVGWSKVFGSRVFDRRHPPREVPLFPFQVGAYGTGANFAVRRSALAALGGFDVRLGAGSAARGGEDIDLFYRLIAHDHLLAYEPSAIVWHRHRASTEALATQAVGYGRGLTAWLTKLALSPGDLARGLAALVRGAVRPGAGTWAAARRHTAHHAGAGAAGDAATRHIGRIERRAMVTGPAAYLCGRGATQ